MLRFDPCLDGLLADSLQLGKAFVGLVGLEAGFVFFQLVEEH